MLEQMIKFYTSGFVFPNITLTGLALGISLGIVFGAICLIRYQPPMFKERWLWAVAASSAILTWAAIAFIQVPLQTWSNQAIVHFWSLQTVVRWLLIAAIPSILLSGLVQEAAKLLPVIVWRHHKKNITAKTGLVIGAIAGAGFGVFEAVWVLNTTFASGWSWNMVESQGFLALLPFFERFFAIAFHIGSCALAGYGLVKGWGWQFYLIAAFLHGLVNYGVVLLQTQVLTTVQVEMWIAILATMLTVVVLWLPRKRPANIAEVVSSLKSAPLHVKE
jgi:hypothetical protein